MKILVIKPSSFGDIVQAAPCAAALKKAYPGCEISWVVFKQWAEIPQLFPDIDNIVIWDRKKRLKGFFELLKEIRKTDFDLIIDLQGLLRSAFLARFAKGRIKTGVPGMKEFSGFLLKEPYPENAKMNATLRNLEPVRFLTGKTYEPDIKIRLGEDDLNRAGTLLRESGVTGRFAVLLPFARGKGKDWSIENYGKLILKMKDKYPELSIAVLGSAGDHGKIGSAAVADLCGKTGIKELAAVLSKADVAIGADTGPMHLSSALNTPSVYIFGISDINETSPRLGRNSLLINKENPAEINRVTAEEVFAEAEKWIK